MVPRIGSVGDRAGGGRAARLVACVERVKGMADITRHDVKGTKPWKGVRKAEEAGRQWRCVRMRASWWRIADAWR